MALRWRRRSEGIALVGVVLVALATGCGSSTPVDERGPQPIVGWANGGELQIVYVDTCNGDPEATVVEDADTVTISVTSTVRASGEECQDSLRIPLDAPLGDRTVIDGVTGDPAPGIEG